MSALPTSTAASPPAAATAVRRHLAVHGIVQGVGFRPFVFLLARRHALVGHVRNTAGGVRIEVQGPPAAVAAFARELLAEPPPLALIESVESTELPCSDDAEFRIVESDASEGEVTPVSPDIAVCAACLAELLDPADRRYRYPFINCTDCGPRFTLITGLPYDRPQTTMRDFTMCGPCAAEYADPLSRRFHAQPNACPDCGPHLWLVRGETTAASQPPKGEPAIAAAREVLSAGGILAIKGIGGFHLACDATRDDAVRRLRERKGRGEKPFALMAASLDVARRYAVISAAEEALLTARQRPIVLVRRRAFEGGPGEPVAAPDGGALTAPPLSDAVAPGQRSLGILLPYAPIHHLLLDERPLVMTSGNRSSEPIARDNGEALRQLGGIADAFLLHDRGIHVVCDDAVVRHDGLGEMPIRRSRGYAPFPVPLPFASPPLLAAGGEIKATFCLARERRAFLSQHIGDMENLETLQAFERAVGHFLTLFRSAPERVACDLHPDYLSTRWAERWAAARGLPLIRVQHHHAHVAAVMAEHGLDGGEQVLGLALDGTGFGGDGTIWGGELLLADYRGFRRLARLRPTPMPGGDGAIRHPWRMALSHLRAAGIAWSPDLPCVRGRTAQELRFLERQLESGLGAPLTSSAGRLFDAVAALLGLRQEASYEGQPAMELEAACEELREAAGADGAGEGYRLDLCERIEPLAPIDPVAPIGAGASGWVLDPAPLLRRIVEDLARGVAAGTIAARFHAGLAASLVALCRRAREGCGIATVALSGGTFQNVRLLRLLVSPLQDAGFRVLCHRRVPPNDGGLALGQAAIAAFYSS